MTFKNAFAKYNKELMARAAGRDLSISTKQSVEICSNIRNKPLKQGKRILEDVITEQRAIRYTRFNRGLGHKPGMASGRYPIKAATHILAVLKSAEANAQVKGLNTGNLSIVHMSAHKAARPLHYGRQRGTTMKRTHIEIVLQEKARESKEKKAQGQPQKREAKQKESKEEK